MADALPPLPSVSDVVPVGSTLPGSAMPGIPALPAAVTSAIDWVLSPDHNATIMGASQAYPVVDVPLSFVARLGFRQQARALSLFNAYGFAIRVAAAAAKGMGVAGSAAELESFALSIAARAAYLTDGAIPVVALSKAARGAARISDLAKLPPTAALCVIPVSELRSDAPSATLVHQYVWDALRILSAPMQAPPIGESTLTSFDPTVDAIPGTGGVTLRTDFLPALAAALGAWPTVALGLGALSIVSAGVVGLFYIDKSQTLKLAAADTALKALESGSNPANVARVYDGITGASKPPTIGERIGDAAYYGAGGALIGAGAITLARRSSRGR